MGKENEVEETVVENEIEETTEVVETEAAPAEGEATPDTEEKEESDGTETESEEEAEPELDKDGKPVVKAEAFKPEVKFKVTFFDKETKAFTPKEMEIDKRFLPLMKDKEGADLIRDLHEKAHGLDSVKERFQQERFVAQEARNEVQAYSSNINELRTAYQEAVKPGGNILKLENWFKKLQVPEEVVAAYSYERAKLTQLPEEQRNAILGKLEQENRADEFAQQQQVLQASNANLAQQIKQTQLEGVLITPEVSPLVAEFEKRNGKPGSFKAACNQAGQFAWLQSGKDLTPQEAVKQVIEMYNLTGTPNLPAASTAPAKTAVSPAGKPIVQKTAATIPNIAGNSRTSPIKSKVGSMEELLKYRKEAHGI